MKVRDNIPVSGNVYRIEVLNDDGEVMGYMLYHYTPAKSGLKASLEGFFVDIPPGNRGRGVFRAIVTHLSERSDLYEYGEDIPVSVDGDLVSIGRSSIAVQTYPDVIGALEAILSTVNVERVARRSRGEEKHGFRIDGENAVARRGRKR